MIYHNPAGPGIPQDLKITEPYYLKNQPVPIIQQIAIPFPKIRDFKTSPDSFAGFRSINSEK
jgi:hypothetical protein